ncbi:hypothetical protein K474DRAFT_1659043 [Panus rudis PR-1116 ss-1]|nr:hypothetical protein K474DRAFT_1659043 [Panus rudis PR-1116 ss-1]
MDGSRTAMMQLKELVYYDDTRDVSGQTTLLTDLLSVSNPLLSFTNLQSLDVTLNSPSALLAANTLLKTYVGGEIGDTLVRFIPFFSSAFYALGFGWLFFSSAAVSSCSAMTLNTRLTNSPCYARYTFYSTH